MRRSVPAGGRRVAELAACVLLAGTIVAAVLAAAGPAAAASCTPGTPCTITGTTTLTAGTLSMTAPNSLTWSATLNGLTQNVVDTVGADQGYTVDDATGSGAGWRVSVAATTFTSTSPAATLPDSGTFSTIGSVTSATATTAPSAACTSGAGSCTLPNDSGISYPVALTTAASPSPTIVYHALAGSGLGSIDIGGAAAANPVGWWLRVLPSAVAGTYTSTVTISLASGP